MQVITLIYHNDLFIISFKRLTLWCCYSYCMGLVGVHDWNKNSFQRVIYPGNIGLKLNDRVLGKLTLEWRLRKRDMTKTEIIQHSGTFYTDKPGYRVQLKSQLDRLHGDIYFSVRILQGLFDETIEWPFQKKFRISISDKMKGHSKESWIIPLNGVWIKELSKPTVKKDAIVSEWKGPFNISQYLDAKTIFFDVSMCN